MHCNINGQSQYFSPHPMQRLLDVLRENAMLTGAKEGCGEGECGACAVMLNGDLVLSCLIPTVQCNGANIETIEGEGTLHQVVRRAFLEKGGAQCGICTPGMIMASVALLTQNPKPTIDEVREGLAGNICRCTGYVKIFDAVLEASNRLNA